MALTHSTDRTWSQKLLYYHMYILYYNMYLYTRTMMVVSRLLRRRNAQQDRIISARKKIIIKG